MAVENAKDIIAASEKLKELLGPHQENLPAVQKALAAIELAVNHVLNHGYQPRPPTYPIVLGGLYAEVGVVEQQKSTSQPKLIIDPEVLNTPCRRKCMAMSNAFKAPSCMETL